MLGRAKLDETEVRCELVEGGCPDAGEMGARSGGADDCEAGEGVDLSKREISSLAVVRVNGA